MPRISSFFTSKPEVIVGIISMLSVVFQWFTGHSFEFHRDELLYLSLGERPDFGYHSVPPFIGFLGFISLKLFGYTLFAARFFPALSGGLLIYLGSQMASELKGGSFARILTAVCLAGSLLFVRASGLFQPVPFDILFWTWALYLFIRYFNTQQPRYILFLGVITGIGFLNKYTLLFLVFSLFISLLLTQHRKILRSKYVLLSVLIAFIIVLPNIIWQLKHGLPVLHHMAELRSSQLVNMNPVTFLSEQILMVAPASLIVFPGIILLFFSKHLKEYRFLGIFFLTMLFLFLLLQGKSYYTGGVYPMLVAIGAVFFEEYTRRRGLRILGIAIIVFLQFLFLPMGKPVFNPTRLEAYFDRMEQISGNDAIRRDEDNGYNRLPQDYSDMLGWEELAGIASRAWNMTENKKSCLLYCENYGQAGAITVIGKQYGLPAAISFSDHFRYWIPRTLDTEITEIIYINDEPGEDVRDLFNDIYEVGKINNPLSREYGTGVYLCKNPRRSFNDFWEDVIEDI